MIWTSNFLSFIFHFLTCFSLFFWKDVYKLNLLFLPLISAIIFFLLLSMSFCLFSEMSFWKITFCSFSPMDAIYFITFKRALAVLLVFSFLLVSVFLFLYLSTWCISCSPLSRAFHVGGISHAWGFLEVFIQDRGTHNLITNSVWTGLVLRGLPWRGSGGELIYYNSRSFLLSLLVSPERSLLLCYWESWAFFK